MPPLLWATAVLQTPHCLEVGLVVALRSLNCGKHHTKSEQNYYPCPKDPELSFYTINLHVSLS